LDGFSFHAEQKPEVWQPSFVDRRVRDSLECAEFKDYIWQNPVKRFLARTAEEYPYASCISRQPGSGTSAAKAGFFIGVTAGMNACSTPWALKLGGATLSGLIGGISVQTDSSVSIPFRLGNRD
jgi:hypothetical protein